MTKGSDVLEMLIPQGGWVITGDTFDGIQFLECEPISRESFEKGFETYAKWQKEQEAIRKQAEADTATALATAKAKLAALGLTADDLKALGLGGN
jgi:hypothetical protein